MIKPLVWAFIVCITILARSLGHCMAHSSPVGPCDATGCVILEVPIKLESQFSSPSQHRQHHKAQIGNKETEFETIITQANEVCIKQVKVPEPVYLAITQVMASMKSSEGNDPPPILTPTQQSILLFYSTLLQQTLGFQCSHNDIQSISGNSKQEKQGNQSNAENNEEDDYTKNENKKAWGVLNGYVEEDTLVSFYLTHNGQHIRAKVGDEIANGWVIEKLDKASQKMILKKGTKFLEFRIRDPIILES